MLIPRGAFDVVRFSVALVDENAFGFGFVQRFGAVWSQVNELPRDLFHVADGDNCGVRMELGFNSLSRRRVDVIMNLIDVDREANNVLLTDVFNELIGSGFEPLFEPTVRERGLVVELVRRINYYALHSGGRVLPSVLSSLSGRVAELIETCVETRLFLLV